MKKLSVVFTAVLVLWLCACGQQPAQTQTQPQPTTMIPTETTAPETTLADVEHTATDADIAALEKLYEGRTAYHGDVHVHTDSGGYSDGKFPLAQWPDAMAELDIDFATVVDHRQVSHMRLSEWDNTLFLGGTEMGQNINNEKGGSDAVPFRVHTNMLFADPESLENVLNEFPNWFFYANNRYMDYCGGQTMSREDYTRLIESVQSNGGFFVFPHPRLKDNSPDSDDPMDFWFVDETGFEVFYGYTGPAEYTQETKAQYELWVQLLALGKRLYATAGSDTHGVPNTNALTTVYSAEQSAQAYISCLRAGDFTPAPMGIRMAVGDTAMGGQTSFAGKRLIFSVGDFHRSVTASRTNFRAVLLSDTGEVFSQEFTADEMAYFAVDADPAVKFYRVEIYDADEDILIGIGNPIWNQ